MTSSFLASSLKGLYILLDDYIFFDIMAVTCCGRKRPKTQFKTPHANRTIT